ncbi:uncharacterized protein LOC112544116 isoform X2 [Pelodiscus sinensis]|uniref:uncharacterized protein LOC112544116 isoform X2 n=1 Tax=Pelodiscus sinensis TaxID=13735 RepID=UPI003F6C7601
MLGVGARCPDLPIESPTPSCHLSSCERERKEEQPHHISSSDDSAPPPHTAPTLGLREAGRTMALVALGGYNMAAPPGPSCVMPLPMPPAGQRGRAERKRLMTSLQEARSLEDFLERVGRRAPKRKAEASLSDGQGGLRQNKLSRQDLRDAPKRNRRLQQEQFRRRKGICRRTQDQRRANRHPNTRRKLLSQSGEGPWLEVSERPAPGGFTTLDCKARGFSTPDIGLVWLRDGEPRPEDTRQGAVLPSTDGTFETVAHIDIDPSPGDTYTCRVERPSLPGGVHEDWKPKSNAQPSVRVGVGVPLIVGVGLLVAGTLL